MATTSAILYSPDDLAPPDAVQRWVTALAVPVLRVQDDGTLMSSALRSRPRVVVFDSRSRGDEVRAALRRMKSDSYTGVVPAVVISADDPTSFDAGFRAGADEVIRDHLEDSEVTIRLDAMLRRSDRDLYVHPSTRLPGAVEIEAEIGRRLVLGVKFATCYADLDHFKEFNDRYSYYEGDRVIRILAQILHDVVKGMCNETGFVGHIGGDDFIFIIPIDAVSDVCSEIVSIFDTLIPYQYSEQDRRAGYFFGKDRRGQLHRVPLMTVSIGVVTNERRHFTHAAQVSALATEMKSYAKTLPGSVYSIDRRTDSRPIDVPGHRRVVWIRGREGGGVNVLCPECRSVFRVDPLKVSAAGVRARCSVCGGVITIGAGASIDEEFGPPPTPTPPLQRPAVAAPVPAASATEASATEPAPPAPVSAPASEEASPSGGGWMPTRTPPVASPRVDSPVTSAVVEPPADPPIAELAVTPADAPPPVAVHAPAPPRPPAFTPPPIRLRPRRRALSLPPGRRCFRLGRRRRRHRSEAAHCTPRLRGPRSACVRRCRRCVQYRRAAEDSRDSRRHHRRAGRPVHASGERNSDSASVSAECAASVLDGGPQRSSAERPASVGAAAPGDGDAAGESNAGDDPGRDRAKCTAESTGVSGHASGASVDCDAFARADQPVSRE